MRKFHVGCSGFQYKNWTPTFYPPKAHLLSFYSERIKSVEINSSFYHLPQSRTCAAWATNTPDDFTFVLKGFQGITHRRRINDSEPMNEYLDKFAEAADCLGHKLVGVLWQFPPTFHFNGTNIDRLLRFADKVHNRLPGNSFEFRHPSWYQSAAPEQLFTRGHAMVRHDHFHGPCLEFPLDRDERLLYYRYHGPNGDCRGRYAPFYMQDQAVGLHERKLPVLAYFNNDVDVGAPFNAQELHQCLESLYSGRGPDLTPIPAGLSIRTLAQERPLVWSR